MVLAVELATYIESLSASEGGFLALLFVQDAYNRPVRVALPSESATGRPWQSRDLNELLALLPVAELPA